MSLLLLSGAGLLGLFLFVGILSILYRRVVSTNEVHIVQSAKNTTSYGKDTGNGNTYYEWPSWIPLLGVTKIVSPVSVFDLDLSNYEAYDKGRLPFVVDVKAFFRITDTNIAAQRVSSFEELNSQLKAIVQGAVRTILAGSEIEEIMQGRSKFGEEFTKEVDGQLANWGVQTVKSIELMDIRDHKDSNVIKNIMEKKKSHIEMESRIEVAKNNRLASVAEIEASKEVELKNQSAQQDVGMRTTEAEREVALALQQKIQVIKDQEKTTKEKEMSVLKVESVRRAEIDKEVLLVRAAQDKETKIVIAEGQKQTTMLEAQGRLESKKLESEGITLEGTARADAEKAMQLAPVEAQIVLAKEIGSNSDYQKYLVTIEQIHAAQSVGEKQAEALSKADVKVITNSGTPGSGITNVMDLFSSNGGTQIGSMLEALSQTDQGKAFMGKFITQEANATTDTTKKTH